MNKNKTIEFNVDDEDFDHYALEAELEKLKKEIEEQGKILDSLEDKVKQLKSKRSGTKI